MYVDGFVIPIQKKNMRAYTKMAQDAGKVWMRFGALQYYECVAEDLKVFMDHKNPKKASFPFKTKFNLKPNETILFSWIAYKSKSHRNQVNKKVMKHFDKLYADKKDMPMPFDVRKMLYGGFKPVVGLKRR